MTAEWLLGWWNVVYLLPFGLALAYLFAYALSGWTFGDAEPEVDADVDVDAEVDVDAGADVDADVDLEADAPGHGLHAPGHDVSADSDVSAEKGAFAAVAWLGVGRVPLSLLLMVLFLTFGTIGFVTNQALREALGAPWVALASLPLAAIGSLGITSLVSRSLVRWLPMTESSARHRRELVGLRATAVFPIDGRQGVAMVRDSGGDRYQVACRTGPGAGAIAGGAEVVLFKYDAVAGVFYVIPSGLAERDDAPRLPERPAARQ